jgi:hypothetical protein
MSDFVRTIAITGVIGALVAGGLTLPAYIPAAMADETPFQPLLDAAPNLFPEVFDPDSLVKFDVEIADSVSTDVTSTQTVTKIGFGHSSVVSIVHTASGTYSSDAMTSPHVLYPGIEVTPKPGIEKLGALLDNSGVTDWTPVYSGSFVLLLANAKI